MLIRTVHASLPLNQTVEKTARRKTSSKLADRENQTNVKHQSAKPQTHQKYPRPPSSEMTVGSYLVLAGGLYVLEA